MYNLTISEVHTYFVGAGQWVVHNACDFEEPYYQSGKLHDQGYLDTWYEKVDTKEFYNASQPFEDFAESEGLPRDGWKYIMETWYSEEFNDTIKQHYWKHPNLGEHRTYYHERTQDE